MPPVHMHRLKAAVAGAPRKRSTASLVAGTLAVGVLLGALLGLLFPEPAPAPTQAATASSGAADAARDAEALLGEPVTVLRPQDRPAPRAEAVLPDDPVMTEATWRRFAAAAPPTRGLALVAVVLDDLGIDQDATRAAQALEGPYTLSYLPYGRHLAEHSAAARAAGHEVLVHVPMQPEGRAADPGPDALLLGLDGRELGRRLQAALDAVPGAVGINNHMGSRFTADAAGMAAVMEALRARGMLFLDSRTTADSVGLPAAAARGVPAVERDVFLDHYDDPAPIRAELARLEAIARKEGSAVAIGHPRPNTLAALRDWRAGLAERGVVLVPLTAVLERRLQVAGRH